MAQDSMGWPVSISKGFLRSWTWEVDWMVLKKVPPWKGGGERGLLCLPWEEQPESLK